MSYRNRIQWRLLLLTAGLLGATAERLEAG
jgi:hypothetical protein